MNDVKKGLYGYLDNEEGAASESKIHWKEELESFNQLGHLFLELDSISRPDEGHLDSHNQLYHILLLTVQHQMFSAVSNLLRTNKNAAFAMTRRAIEATGIAHCIFKKPSLKDTFLSAYPNILQEGHAKQWKPSNQYSNAFSAKKLFPNDEPILRSLHTIYEITCISDVHVSPFLLNNLKSNSGKTYLVANEADPQELDKCWLRLLMPYLEALRIFLKVLSTRIKLDSRQEFSKKMDDWRVKARATAKYKLEKEQAV